MKAGIIRSRHAKNAEDRRKANGKNGSSLLGNELQVSHPRLQHFQLPNALGRLHRNSYQW